MRNSDRTLLKNCASKKIFGQNHESNEKNITNFGHESVSSKILDEVKNEFSIKNIQTKKLYEDKILSVPISDDSKFSYDSKRSNKVVDTVDTSLKIEEMVNKMQCTNQKSTNPVTNNNNLLNDSPEESINPSIKINRSKSNELNPADDNQKKLAYDTQPTTLILKVISKEANSEDQVEKHSDDMNKNDLNDSKSANSELEGSIDESDGDALSMDVQEVNISTLISNHNKSKSNQSPKNGNESSLAQKFQNQITGVEKIDTSINFQKKNFSPLIWQKLDTIKELHTLVN